MPRKTKATSKKAESQDPVDVVIITALKEEYDAVLEVDTGALPPRSWQKKPGPNGLEIASRTFQGAQGGRLNVVVAQAPDMGGPAAVGTAAQLVTTYKPRCLAMCGVCAGWEGKVELGDVIIADQVWDYDSGKLERSPMAMGPPTERFQSRNLPYHIHPVWKQQARSFKVDGKSSWLAKRPRPYPFQMEWVLERLLREEDPAQHPQRLERCADYPKVMELLREKGWVHKTKQPLSLTKTGREHIQRRLNDHPDGLPEPQRFQVHVGSIATGNKVLRVPGTFEQLSLRNYAVLGLEMEAAALAAFAHQSQLPYMVVMKGVMDFADLTKGDRFKPFAAQASAECLLAFLREHLPATAKARARAAPSRRALEKALSTYKRALAEEPPIRRLDLRRLLGIPTGPHQTELDLLDFAVAPSLHDETEEQHSLTAPLRSQLRQQDLEPAKRKELQAKLDRLEDAQWEHRRAQGQWYVDPVSFAKVLHRHRRFVIIGEPGAGKSVLTRLALLACEDGEAGERARQLLAGDDPFDRTASEAVAELRTLLPVRLMLGRLSHAFADEQKLSLLDYIHRQLRKRDPEEELFGGLSRLLQEGRLFLLCDGLDEVPWEQRPRVVDAVTEFLAHHPDIRFVLTSRPYGYRPRVPHLQHTWLAPLDTSQQRRLVSRLHYLVSTHRQDDAASVARAQRHTHSLLAAIRASDDWRQLSSNPLLLTLCALMRTNEEGTPRHRVFVFENFIRTLLGAWRLEVAPPEADRLLDVWASIASEMVRQERRGGMAEAQVRRMLTEALASSPSSGTTSAEAVLLLALETGLVRKEEESIAFWHPTFAEFLAAYALTGQGNDAARRLLETGHWPLLVLKLAAARLALVLDAYDQVDRLGSGLLARDETGEGRLLRPGLRAVSACLADNVPFSSPLVERVWISWAEVLERTPPSLLWDDFVKFAEHALLPAHCAYLVERFAQIDDRGLDQVQQRLARIIALSGVPLPPSAQEACSRWLRRFHTEPQKLYGAFGLISSGHWSEELLDTLGRFGHGKVLSPGTVGALVRRLGPPLLERLRQQVSIRLPLDEPSSEQSSAERQAQERGFDQRLSAACLLAASGAWDSNVSHVLRVALSGRPSANRLDEAKAAVRYCSDDAAAQRALLDWIAEDSQLGESAREIVREVAPLIEQMPEAVLERTTRAEGPFLEKLDKLVAAVGMERRSLLDTLRRWLSHEQEERQLRAARILRRFVPRDEYLHQAIRRGLKSRDLTMRARWAPLTFGLTRELSDAALKTLEACARSPESSVREQVYEGMSKHWGGLTPRQLAGWLACAADSTVPEAARLDAAAFLLHASKAKAPILKVLRELLDAEDASVRRAAASKLLYQDTVTLRLALVVAEEAARTFDTKLIRHLPREKATAARVIRVVLRELPREEPPPDPKDPFSSPGIWSSYLQGFAVADLSCVEDLFHALEYPGLASDIAERVLRSLAREHVTVRDAIRQRMQQAARRQRARELFSLIDLSLEHDETRGDAIDASRVLDTRDLSQAALLWLAGRLSGARAEEDAARLWRFVLDGAKPKLALRAAQSLALYALEAEGERIQAALKRLLDTPDPIVRMDAGHLALAHGWLEEKALATLDACLELRGQPVQRALHEDWVLRAIDFQVLSPSRHSGQMVLLRLHAYTPRIDFEAMHTLCVQRPEVGLVRLARWLEDAEWERFDSAVGILTKLGHSREAILASIEARLRSAPDREFRNLISLAIHHGFYSTQLVELVLARYSSREKHDLEMELIDWVRERSEIWSLIRRQGPARRDVFAFLLEHEPLVGRDTVAFCVEFALAHANDTSGLSVERYLERWCSSGADEASDAGLTADPKPSELIRGWLREVLAEQPEPDELGAILSFDTLSELAGAPVERRVSLLRRALARDFTATLGEEDSVFHMLGNHAEIGLRLLKLGVQDEHTLPVLKLAVHELARGGYYIRRALELAQALLSLRPGDASLRESLVHAFTAIDAPYYVAALLDLLMRTGASKEQCIDILLVCLGAQPVTPNALVPPVQSARWRDFAIHLLDALKELGCAPELYMAVLRQFASTHGTQCSPSVRMELAARSDLPTLTVATLLLSVIAQHTASSDEARRQWMERFASRRPKEAKDDEWRYSESGYVSLRHRTLAKLSQVDDPAQLEMLLAAVAVGPGESFLASYRQARGGASLADPTWAEIMDGLAVEPGEEPTTRFAKEWLTFLLWQAKVPELVDAFLRS
jgi:nucleoside phosphorylase